MLWRTSEVYRRQISEFNKEILGSKIIIGL